MEFLQPQLDKRAATYDQLREKRGSDESSIDDISEIIRLRSLVRHSYQYFASVYNETGYLIKENDGSIYTRFLRMRMLFCRKEQLRVQVFKISVDGDLKKIVCDSLPVIYGKTADDNGFERDCVFHNQFLQNIFFWRIIQICRDFWNLIKHKPIV